MAIYKGDKKVIALYKGDKKIIKKYKGTQVVYDSTPKKNNILSFEFTGTSEKYYINDVEYTATSSPFSIEIKDTITSCANMFGGLANKTITAITSIPDTTMSKDMNRMFVVCTGVTDFSVVKTMNTSSCTNMYQMFAMIGAKELDLSHFDTSNVTDMSFMFTSSTYLEKLNVKGWNTKNVTTMQQMFNACSGLTELDLSGWDVTSVTDFGSMFARCFSLKTIDVSGWNTLNSGTGHSNKPIFGITATNPNNNSSIYANLEELVVGEDCSDEQYEWWCARLAESNIDCNVITYKKNEPTSTSTLTFNWSKTGTSQPTFYTRNAESGVTFYTATTNPYTVDIAKDQEQISFNALDVVNISSFPNDRSWSKILISNFIGNNLVLKDIDLTKATRLFSDLMITASTYSSIDLSGLKLSDTVDMSDYQAPKVNTLIMDDWYFNNVITIFKSNNVLKNLSLKNVNTSAVTSMVSMFYNCSGLTELDLSSFNTSNVTETSQMFQGCSSLQTLNVTGWDVSKIEYSIFMFYNCSSLTKLILGSVTQEQYDWWYARLSSDNLQNKVTIEYTISNAGGGTSEAE